MRFERNETQTPKYLVPPEQRRTLPFYLLIAAIIIFALGAIGFFGAFIYRDLLGEKLFLAYRTVQSYSLALGGAGIILYIIMGIHFKIQLKNTSYYKLRTIVKNEPYDPPRKGDFSKAIRARLAELSDEWVMFTEVKTPGEEFHIPQVIVGPGGVYAIYPSNQNASRRKYPDAGSFMKSACNELSDLTGEQVIPIILFPTKKLASIYTESRDKKTRVMHVLEIEEYFKKRNNKLEKKQREKIEKIVYDLIVASPPIP